MELELRHLRVLCAIADAGGVGRAAAALGYTQPAMSTQLRRIEGLLGEGVFLRSSAGVELTAYAPRSSAGPGRSWRSPTISHGCGLPARPGRHVGFASGPSTHRWYPPCSTSSVKPAPI